jgi:hypothetical protein
MRYVERTLAKSVMEASRAFPAVVLTGPRRTGKTTLLRKLFPKAQYVILEDPDTQARVRADPRGFLDELRTPVIFDEIQNAPELFGYIRTKIDRAPRVAGKWFFTGSQEAPLMRGVSESMAGRAALFQLLPFSVAESDRVDLLCGGFPEVLARPRTRGIWFSSYLQTYLERDVRGVLNVRDLVTFRRFLAVLASRHGQILNKTDLAAPLGVSVPTIGEWLSILEVTGQIVLVPPYYENLGKRLLKTPKVYVGDSGLACYLLGIQTQAELERSPFLGAVMEGFVAAEVLKGQVNRGGRKELYFFRDQQGMEVDFVIPEAGGSLWVVECKASRTVTPAQAKQAAALRDLMGAKRKVRAAVVHRKAKEGGSMRALARGVEAVGLREFAREAHGLRGKGAGG